MPATAVALAVLNPTDVFAVPSSVRSTVTTAVTDEALTVKEADESATDAAAVWSVDGGVGAVLVALVAVVPVDFEVLLFVDTPLLLVVEDVVAAAAEVLELLVVEPLSEPPHAAKPMASEHIRTQEILKF